MSNRGDDFILQRSQADENQYSIVDPMTGAVFMYMAFEGVLPITPSEKLTIFSRLLEFMIEDEEIQGIFDAMYNRVGVH